MNFIKSAFLHLLAALTGLGEKAWSYIESEVVPIVEKDAEETLPKLAPIAEAAVLQFETSGKVGNDKRNAAYAVIEAGAKSAGLDVAGRVLNLALELAVSKLTANGQINVPVTAPTAGTAPVSESLPTSPASGN